MKSLTKRSHMATIQSWLLSAIVHLSTLLVLALLLQPLAGASRNLIEITGASAWPTDEPAWLDLENAAEVSVTVAPEQPAEGLTAQVKELQVDSPAEVARRNARSGPHGFDLDVTEGQAEAPGQATFFGTQAVGSEFVYILDVSPSMNARSGQRLDRAVIELLRSIEQLRSSQSFYVMVFGWQTRDMFDQSELVPRMIAATSENKERLRAWLSGVQTIGGTDPRAALQVGVALRPHAVFLLSDGEFNHPPAAVSFFSGRGPRVADVVKDSSVPVHTIAFEDRKSEPGMQKIAKSTKGTHRFIPAADTERPRRKKGTSTVSRRSGVEPVRHREERVSTLLEKPTHLVEPSSPDKPAGADEPTPADEPAYSEEPAYADKEAQRQATTWLERGLQHQQAGEALIARQCFLRVLREFPGTAAAIGAAHQVRLLDRDRRPASR